MAEIMLIPTDRVASAYEILVREGNIEHYNSTTSRGIFAGGQKFQIFGRANEPDAIHRLRGYAFTTYRKIACTGLGPGVQEHIDQMVARYRKIA